jgi:hypothetical protein
VVGKAKASVTRSLGSSVGRIWQENLFEHRLRADEETEGYGFYLFMNPYVAGLADPGQPWSGWACSDETRLRFLSGRSAGGAPAPGWLDRASQPYPRLVVRSPRTNL